MLSCVGSVRDHIMGHSQSQSGINSNLLSTLGNHCELNLILLPQPPSAFTHPTTCMWPGRQVSASTPGYLVLIKSWRTAIVLEEETTDIPS